MQIIRFMSYVACCVRWVPLGPKTNSRAMPFYYLQDICGNLLGEGGSQMSNFLTNAVRARYSRVNHDVPLKDYM